MKRLSAVFLVIILVLTGCSTPLPDLDNIKESYSSILSMPYAQLIGKSLEETSDKTGNLTFNEKENRYYSDKTIMEFTPYFVTNDDGLIKICGFKTEKENNEEIVSYIRGLYNICCALYGSVSIDSDIVKRVNSIDDFSKCKEGESYDETWAKDGFPIEYNVSFEKGKAVITVQYNKLPK